MTTEQEIKEIFCNACELQGDIGADLCADCFVHEAAHELYTKMNQPTVSLENLREEIAKELQQSIGREVHGSECVVCHYFENACGEDPDACSYADQSIEWLECQGCPQDHDFCLSKADSILSLIQPALDKARKEGRREVVEWVKEHKEIAYLVGYTNNTGRWDYVDSLSENRAWQAQLRKWGLDKEV